MLTTRAWRVHDQVRGAMPILTVNAELSARQAKRQRKMQRDNRMICGARRRCDGQPCQALSVPGKKRCKWHGGCSTGPRTVEGKARVTANLPKRRGAS